MALTTTALVDNRVLVQGTDFLGVDGKTVLDSSQWLEVGKQQQFKSATKEFNSTVEEFFAPLTDAADKLEAAKQGDAPDPVTFVVIDEPTEGVPATPGRYKQLTHDSIVLRLLEEGQQDRLAWVNDQLEVIASPKAAAPVAQPGMTATSVEEV